jgi:hypothetical protein
LPGIAPPVAHDAAHAAALAPRASAVAVDVQRVNMVFSEGGWGRARYGTIRAARRRSHRHVGCPPLRRSTPYGACCSMPRHCEEGMRRSYGEARSVPIRKFLPHRQVRPQVHAEREVSRGFSCAGRARRCKPCRTRQGCGNAGRGFAHRPRSAHESRPTMVTTRSGMRSSSVHEGFASRGARAGGAKSALIFRVQSCMTVS